MGAISSAGLGSGLDVNSIITSLMKVEARPLDMLKQQASTLNTQISTYGKVQSYFSTLKDKANALSSGTLWDSTTATASDTTSIKVSAGAGATAGNYAVTVGTLAKSQTVVAAAQASSSVDLGAGMITIELGTWSGSPIDTFTAKSGATPVSVDIPEGAATLADVRDAINAANAGVVASIVTDASGARLSIRSKDTGVENGFRISATETFDDGNAATGLSSLNFDLAGGPSQMTEQQAASNATLLINGIPVSSASNTLNDVVDGLSITLLKTTASAVDVSVAPDTAGIKTKITEFVTAYNELSTYLRTQTAYNGDTKAAGPLQGDQAAVSLLNQLRGVLNQTSSASTAWTQLSQAGISMKGDGSLAIDDTKLNDALKNLPELEKLLATDGADAASSGFIRRYKDLADAALGASGTFSSKTSGLQDRLKRNTKSQDAMQVRLDQTEARLRKQYQALDASMASLSGLSSYVTQQMAMLAKNTGSS
ncbi:MAG: flagellar filament capping protein FliD [Burkholderiales bacterium]|nr:flagellar filament capping protein FliD [Burkholderiales bacterium]